MRKNILFRTNLFVCTVIVIGFAITSIISYYSNRGIFEQDVERVSTLTLEGIYHQIDSIFTKPINVSLTMANDQLLKTFLMEEVQRLDDEDFVSAMRDYLYAYHAKYAFDSVFLVSAATDRYYHFDGIDRVLARDNPVDHWYYAALKSDKEYTLNVDTDWVARANREITIFVNCSIKGRNEKTIGVVGVGLAVNHIQSLLKEYEDKFGIRAYLVDQNGMIQISTGQTKFAQANFFEVDSHENLKQPVLSEQPAWYSSRSSSGYAISKYIPNLGWYLIIDHDTSMLEQKLSLQFLGGVAVVTFVIAFVVLTITSIIRKFNCQIVQLTIAKEQKHRALFQQATEQLYESIYEIDITHNRAASEAAETYFESLGVPKNTPYDKALRIIAKKQIKEEFQQGYLDTFMPSNVLQAYDNHAESLRYELMISTDGKTYHWMRITTRIFYWDDDKSIRMFVYCQNIDMEKQQEKQMLELMDQDYLSGLYNKAATQNHIRQLLAEEPAPAFAFIILDIDNFKKVNDTFGHAIGDQVITNFSNKLKALFQKGDVVGRIGGDEFVVFIPAPAREWMEEKAQSLSAALRYQFDIGGQSCKISASIGIAIAPEAGLDFETLYQNADFALYQTKRRGKNGYTIYKKQ